MSVRETLKRIRNSAVTENQTIICVFIKTYIFNEFELTIYIVSTSSLTHSVSRV